MEPLLWSVLPTGASNGEAENLRWAADTPRCWCLTQRVAHCGTGWSRGLLADMAVH